MPFEDLYLDAVHSKIKPTDNGIEISFYENKDLKNPLSTRYTESAEALAPNINCRGRTLSLSHKAYVFLEALCIEKCGLNYCQDTLTNGYLTTIKNLTEEGMPEKQAVFETANHYLSKIQLQESEKATAENCLEEMMLHETDWHFTG